MNCTSGTDKNCETLTESLDSVECMPTVYGYSNGCFTHIKEAIVQRGCLNEAPEEIRHKCLNNAESCLLCEESNCNNDIADVENFCYECDSNVDLNCTFNVLPYMEKKCDPSKKGCYLIRENHHINGKPIFTVSK